jgi:hypothetical protein
MLAINNPALLGALNDYRFEQTQTARNMTLPVRGRTS